MATRIALNAKCSRPSVCNAMETLLADESVAEAFLPGCLGALRDAGVEIRGCAKTKAIVPWVLDAAPEDWDEEYGALILAVKVVSGMEEAIAHIHAHGTQNSECIVTQDDKRALEFLRRVDASAVYHNVSTRFTDGAEFGFGAEIGISNQKLHARGPMGPQHLTSYKYTVRGSGQVRQ
jgi:glutamate-5-semialdehyde dehydrogenase